MISDLCAVSLSKEWTDFSLGGAERAVYYFFFRISTQKGVPTHPPCFHWWTPLFSEGSSLRLMLTPFAVYPSAYNALPPDNTFFLRSFFISLLEESVKAGLKLSIQKIKIMALNPITSWQIDAEKVETVTDLIFLGSRFAEDSDCSHEVKRCLLLGRKARTNLNSILKCRHHFTNKGPHSQSYAFSIRHV